MSNPDSGHEPSIDSLRDVDWSRVFEALYNYGSPSPESMEHLRADIETAASILMNLYPDTDHPLADRERDITVIHALRIPDSYFRARHEAETVLVTWEDSGALDGGLITIRREFEPHPAVLLSGDEFLAIVRFLIEQGMFTAYANDKGIQAR